MTFSIHRLRAVCLYPVLALLAVLAIDVAPASAATCVPSTAGASQVFSKYGDGGTYTLSPNGNLASGTTGWGVSGATLASGGGLFAGSLTINGGGTALSPSFCVNGATPTFRFYTRQVSGGWAEMNVFVLWTDSAGVTHVTCAGGIGPQSAWSPSPVFDLGNMLPTENGDSFVVRIEFVPAAGGGAVGVSGLYVDPYSRN
jgi:hypothetical protein